MLRALPCSAPGKGFTSQPRWTLGSAALRHCLVAGPYLAARLRRAGPAEPLLWLLTSPTVPPCPSRRTTAKAAGSRQGVGGPCLQRVPLPRRRGCSAKACRRSAWCPPMRRRCSARRGCQAPAKTGPALRIIKEALDNRSPVEAVPCTNWELRALTGAAEGLSRASLTVTSHWCRDRIGHFLRLRPLSG